MFIVCIVRTRKTNIFIGGRGGLYTKGHDLYRFFFRKSALINMYVICIFIRTATHLLAQRSCCTTRHPT